MMYQCIHEAVLPVGLAGEVPGPLVVGLYVELLLLGELHLHRARVGEDVSTVKVGPIM